MINLLLLLVLFKGIVWSTFVPLWQFPDEQAHFNHIAFNVEEPNLINIGEGLDLNQEIAISEQLLGTYRDEKGNNNFTYHPEYNLEYSNSQQGFYEEQIKNLPLEKRFNLVGRESAYYPEIYYDLSGLIYKLFYYQNLFIRVFAVRFFWLFTQVLMIWLAYKIGQIIFPKKKLLAISVAILSGFQPMLTFVSAGVTNDNLHNLLFTAVIYFCLKIIQKIRWIDLAGLGVTLYLEFLNKPQFWVALGIVIPVLFWRWRRFFVLIIAGLFLLYTKGKLPYFEISNNLVRPDYSLWEHLKFMINHTIREVLPWYWGVFRWLSLVLPRWVNRAMMRILLVAGIGLVIKLFRRRFEPGFWIIVWSAAVYFLALFFWDYQHVRNSGFSFGIQGRYYFPVIVPHMVLLVMGLKEISDLIFPKITNYLLLITNYWFIALNWITFYTVTGSYYDTHNFKTFISQASQYKPFFAKGWWLIVVLSLSLILSGVLSVKLFKLCRHEK